MSDHDRRLHRLDGHRLERRRLLSTLQDVFQNLSDAVIVADVEEGAVAFWNHAAEIMFGYSEAEALGLPLVRLMPERIRQLHRAGLTRYRLTGHGGYVETHKPIELPALRKDGDEMFVELSLSALQDLPVPGQYVMAIIRDVTQRKRGEEELRQSHVRLQGALREAEEPPGPDPDDLEPP